MTTLWTQRTWVFPRRLLDDFLGLTLLVWGGFVVVIAGITIGIAAFGTVEESIWDFAVELPPWYAAFISGYVAHDRLPLHVAHGQVRRDFAIQGTIFIVLFAAALAVLITLGFVLERGLYHLADWPQELSQDHLFTSPTELPLIFIEYWLVFLVWTAAGALVGAAFYRSEAVAAVATALALIPISATGIAIGSEWGPIGSVVDVFFDEPGSLPLAAALAIGLGSFLLALAMTWPVVRDIPIRNKAS